MNAPADAARLHVAVFDHARRDFLAAVDRFLAADAIAPEDRAAEITATQRVLADKLRLMAW